MNPKKIKLAFSLIELSIVVVVVGVLIAGVVHSSKMTIKAKLKSAQSLTISSPVLGIKDLVLWLETSLDQSFTSDQVSDGANLYRWISNTRATLPYYAIRTASSAVTYKEVSPINSLPAIYFNGSGTLTLSTTTSASNYTFIRNTMNCNVTWFIVSKPNSISSTGDLFYNTTVNGGYGYRISSNTRTAIMYTVNTTSSATNLTLEPEIASYTYTNTSDTIAWSPLRLYANGYNLLPSGQLPCRPPVGSGTYFVIGPNFSGYIAEMIFYDRSLKTEERQAVENYLSQKYSIKLNR